MNNASINDAGLINGANISAINLRTQNQSAFINNSTFNGVLSTASGIYPTLLWTTIEPTWALSDAPASSWVIGARFTL